MSDTLNAVLEQRGATYGDYPVVAALSQALKNTIMQHYFEVHGGDSATPLPPYMAESISMICHKLSRIANGNPYYADNWQDIAGYAELAVRELDKQTKAYNPKPENNNTNNNKEEVE